MSGHPCPSLFSASLSDADQYLKPQIVDIGDQPAVKRLLDEHACKAVEDAGYPCDFQMSNTKLIIMTVACVVACIGQFAPIPFPQSRPLLAVCCALYFIFSGVLQYITSFVDKDYIMETLPNSSGAYEGKALRIATDFPRFSDLFEVRVELLADPATQFVKKESVGKWFTEEGEFYETAFEEHVQAVVRSFETTVLDKKKN